MTLPPSASPRTVAIVQSNYIPWKGYFDTIARADNFILLDDVQFTRRDWRNRNRIKTAQGLQWLTIPVGTKSRYHQRIDETRITDAGWAAKHLNSIRHAYAKAACFAEVFPKIERLYENVSDASLLSEVNETFIRGLGGMLGISTPISRSTDYFSHAELDAFDASERLLRLTQAENGARYLSGPAAKRYLNHDLFEANGVDVDYMSYEGYPEHRQLHGGFEHSVSVIDLLLNEGEAARGFMLTPHSGACA